ncbi:MAG: DUF4381 family protein [Gammaproteobacteria bacterium]
MNDTGTLSRLADIELPAAPDWQPFIIAAAAIVAITAILIAAWLAWRSRKRRAGNRQPATPLATAQTRLEQTRMEWQAGKMVDREAAYQLATLLRLGLGLPQLTPECPAHFSADQTAWRDTLHLFEQLRYQQAPQVTLTLEVFQRAKNWLAGAEGDT